jgi:tetratricopeptide (TPR) repeat protein
MLSYWLNFKTAGQAAVSYHAWNVVLHAVNSILVFFVVRRLLLSTAAITTQARLICAGAAAALFLLHPVQTESVAYIAGRSEVLTAFFELTALLILLRQPFGTISWPSTLAIVVLCACAVLSKEQAVILPAALLWTDLFLHGYSFKEVWKARRRLYLALTVVAAVGLVMTWSILREARSAGFDIPGLAWYQYFFTQLRVVFLYIRLFLFPIQQNADYDIPLSHTLFEHGAIFGLAGLVALVWAALRVRQRYALATYGLILFLILLAPTSSLIPIKDLAAERRLYLPVIGLTVVCVQFALALKQRSRAAVACLCVLVVFAFATYDRCRVWANQIAFWEDTLPKSPMKTRGYQHLMMAYVKSGRCVDALSLARRAPGEVAKAPEFLVNWANAYECTHNSNDALDKFRRAAAISPTAGYYLLLAFAYQRSGHPREAETTLNEALRREVRTPFDRDMLEVYQQSSRARTMGR